MEDAGWRKVGVEGEGGEGGSRTRGAWLVVGGGGDGGGGGGREGSEVNLQLSQRPCLFALVANFVPLLNFVLFLAPSYLHMYKPNYLY